MGKKGPSSSSSSSGGGGGASKDGKAAAASGAEAKGEAGGGPKKRPPKGHRQKGAGAVIADKGAFVRWWCMWVIRTWMMCLLRPRRRYL